jgi:hypothetical protein
LTRITALAAILVGINVQAKAQTYVSGHYQINATNDTVVHGFILTGVQ